MTKTIKFPKNFDPKGPVLAQLTGTPWEAAARQIFEDGRRDRKREIETEAAAAVDEHHLGMVKAVFGEEAAARFKALVESGLTVSQYANLKPQFESASEDPEIKSLRLVRSIHETALKRQAGDSDFLSAVQRTMAAEKLTKSSAMSRVVAEQPDLHKRFLQAHNQGMEV
jgi:hypothetical protein